jgi:hypothetical protein
MTCSAGRHINPEEVLYPLGRPLSARYAPYYIIEMENRSILCAMSVQSGAPRGYMRTCSVNVRMHPGTKAGRAGLETLGTLTSAGNIAMMSGLSYTQKVFMNLCVKSLMLQAMRGHPLPRFAMAQEAADLTGKLCAAAMSCDMPPATDRMPENRGAPGKYALEL